jgi:DNA-binding GntR family transcriptional regulator
MNAGRIAPLALYQEVAERLRQRIFAHELPPAPGWTNKPWPPITDLAHPAAGGPQGARLRGLVTLKPRRGCYVTEISERDLDEIFTVMALLEGQCAADTARKASETDLIHLRSVHDELERAAGTNDIDGFFEANQAFHQEVQHIADNRWLTQAITDLRKVIKLSRHHSLFSDGRLKQSLAEHRAILDALAHRDVARSEQLMREHISSGRQALAKVAARRDSAA